MLRAMQAGLSGLKANQLYMDVIGDNLANVNTPGFKGSRVTFMDMFSQTLRWASAPSGNRGGINPVQVGLGVLPASIDPKMIQGALNTTGRPFDLGIQGEGFFVLSDGAMQYYTRAGTFGLDAEGNMVDQATGMRVQSPALTDIQVDTHGSVPASATTEVALAGTLPAVVTGPLAEVLTTNTPFQEGTEAVITGTAAQPFALSDGDTLTIRVNGGAAQQVVFHAADFADIGNATAAEVAAVINAQVTGITASDSGGALQLQTQQKGADASIDVDDVTGAPGAALGLDLSLVTGSQTAAVEGTDLNDLVSNTQAYAAGDRIHLAGKDAEGNVLDLYFTYGTDGTTVGELRAFIDNHFSGVTCTLDAQGNLVLEADEPGEADLALFIQDDPDAAGSTSWTSFDVTTDGADPDEAVTSVSVYDSLGIAHTLTLTFRRTASPPDEPNTWQLDVSLPDGDGTITQNPIESIRFNPDGSFATVLGGTTISVDFANGSDPNQAVTMDFGTAGQFDGIVMVGDTDSVMVESQDGYAAGDLASLSVDQDGTIIGLYTNGQFQELGQVGLATFANPAGLEKKGNSLFFVSTNSGEAAMNTPGSNGAGTLLSGALEQSNVDISEEFVNLIEAQRAFQANARIISTSDEVLMEAVNLIR